MSNLSKVKTAYNQYFERIKDNRNDLLSNPEVLFQNLAMFASIVSAFSMFSEDRKILKILDVGCGKGDYLMHWFNWGFDIKNLYGIDILEECIKNGQSQYPNFNLSCSDASEMDFDDVFFDIVFENCIFLQITDNELAEKIASQMLRVVKKGGFIIISDWRYGRNKKEHLAMNKKRLTRLFNVGEDTTFIKSIDGALAPPIGRFISKKFSSIYFLVQKMFPFLVGQKVTILKKNKKGK